MAKKGYVLIDSCVLLDVFNDDLNWYEWSSQTLYQMSKEYNLAINMIVFTEIAFNFESCELLEKELARLAIQILDIPISAAFNVSKTFKQYRKNSGDKKTPMPDFYIGEHALILGVPLITRDTSGYKTYQPQLKLISPKKKIKH